LPEPVTGSALMDTGTRKTCLDINSARRACLPQIGVAQTISATHTKRFLARVFGNPTLRHMDEDAALELDARSVEWGLGGP